MKRNLLITSLGSFLLLVSCDQTTQSIPQINLDTEYPEKEIYLQDVAEVSYLPLETTNEVLFNGSFTDISPKGMVSYNRRDGAVFVFDGTGKTLLSMNHRGEGPSEYTEVKKVSIDWEKQEIYVLDIKKHILVYDLTGKYIRTIDIPVETRHTDMYPYGENNFILFKQIPEGINVKVIQPYRPLLLLSRTSNQLDSLPYTKKENVYITAYIGDMSGIAEVGTLRSYYGQTYLNDISCDTIFHLNEKNNQLTPILTRTPSILAPQDTPYVLTLEGVTTRYIFLKKQIKDHNLEDPNSAKGNRFIAYDRVTQEFFRPIFKNKDYTNQAIQNKDFSLCEGEWGNHFILEAFKLKEALEENTLNGELKAIAEQIDEEDNPVVMIIQYN